MKTHFWPCIASQLATRWIGKGRATYLHASTVAWNTIPSCPSRCTMLQGPKGTLETQNLAHADDSFTLITAAFDIISILNLIGLLSLPLFLIWHTISHWSRYFPSTFTCRSIGVPSLKPIFFRSLTAAQLLKPKRKMSHGNLIIQLTIITY